MFVLVVDQNRKPLNPCHPARARKFLKFLNRKPDLLGSVLSVAKRPLKDAAAVNSTRWALYRVCGETGLPIETIRMDTNTLSEGSPVGLLFM